MWLLETSFLIIDRYFKCVLYIFYLFFYRYVFLCHFIGTINVSYAYLTVLINLIFSKLVSQEHPDFYREVIV
jgi:hypothetical protein